MSNNDELSKQSDAPFKEIDIIPVPCSIDMESRYESGFIWEFILNTDKAVE